MLYVIANDTDDIALVNNVTEDKDGVWIWMGFFKDAIAKEIVPGTIIRNWVLWTRGENHDRTDLEVLKVNRVTIKVRAKDDGQVHTIRIDR